MSDKAKILLAGSLGLVALGLGLRKKLGVREVVTAPRFKENRVYVRDYGRLPSNSPLLVDVPSLGSRQRLHVLAAQRLEALSREAAKAGFPDIKIASGWRPHRWQSWDQYVSEMERRYGSLAEGRRKMAYNSAHETGLAMDFGAHGVYPSFKGAGPFGLTNEQQKQTPFYKWLQNNAHRFGLTPYAYEAWHWEVKVPRVAWQSGEEFTPHYGVRV